VNYFMFVVQRAMEQLQLQVQPLSEQSLKLRALIDKSLLIRENQMYWVKGLHALHAKGAVLKNKVTRTRQVNVRHNTTSNEGTV